MAIRFIDLCSGIGGFHSGLMATGHFKCVGHSKKFLNLKDGSIPDPSTYDEVFNAEIQEDTLEAIYTRFNTEYHPLFRGHSLSVSDVVDMNGKTYCCQSVGFVEVPFDESKTMKPDNLMRVVYVEPNKPAYTYYHTST